MPDHIHQRAGIHYFGLARGSVRAEYLTGDPGLYCGLGPNRAGRNLRPASSITTTHEPAGGDDRRWAADAIDVAKDCQIRRRMGVRDPRGPSAPGLVGGRQVRKRTALPLDGRCINPGGCCVVLDRVSVLKLLILAGSPTRAAGADSRQPGSSNLSPSPGERSAASHQRKPGPSTADLDRCPDMPTSATPPRPP